MNKNIRFSLQNKITGIYIVANIIMLIISIILITGINSMSLELDKVYFSNRHLNELSGSIDNLQSSMTEYLTYKTSDSLEHYYICDQQYRDIMCNLSDKITDSEFILMERNIKYMSEDYLDVVSQTVEAKRGRNVEKYRMKYEEATELYEYIKTYINSLNTEQFAVNSLNYTVVSEGFKRFEIFSLIIMVSVCALNIVIIVNMIKSLIRPLKDLANVANEVSEGNFEVQIFESEAKDETGILTNAFGKMVVNIKDYINKLRESMEKERVHQEKELMMETHLKDAQLKYLQAQINPHFLFNTLNACAQLAMMEGADKTYEYVQTVADFFRYNVRKQDKIVTVGEELTLVDDYITILNVRFSGDIHYQKQIDERLLSIKMPAMILQPIVENAVNHGIREMAGDGTIYVKLFRKNDRVLISIKDNGKGMTPEDIKRVISGTGKYEEHKSDNNGIGMDNVILRMKLHTEYDDAITIKSDGENMGTEVIVSLPYMRNGE